MSKSPIYIAIVDDDAVHRDLVSGILADTEFQFDTFASGSDFLNGSDLHRYDIVLLDYRLGDMTGMDVLAHLHKSAPMSKVIMVTAFANLDLAVEAIKSGAFDFIRKPAKKEELLLRIRKTIDFLHLDGQLSQLRSQLSTISPDDSFVFTSKKMKKTVMKAMKVAGSDATVLIEGETGTGKERIAEIIHAASPRKERPFIKLNVAAIPESLIESELFGAEKGAYTGADKRMIGKFEAAHRGTLFLDEITELPLSSQVKLLRVLQDKAFFRLGSVTPIKIDVRIIAATNQKIESLVAEKKFRDDLYYRLNVIHIPIPALRERREDVLKLIDYFIKKSSEKEKKHIKGVERKTLKKLLQYHFPGNIRELENLIERAVILTESDWINESDIGVFFSDNPEIGFDLIHSDRSLPEVIESIERKYIREALESTGGVKVKAAKRLGITERVLRYRIEQLKIDLDPE